VLHPQLTNQVVLKNAVEWMYGASWIIYSFALFFICYSILIFLQNRHQELGIWFMQGMSLHQFRIMIFYENLSIGILSIIVGIICGISVEKLFLLICTQIMDITNLEFYFPWKAILITTGVYLFLFVILAYGTPLLAKIKNKMNYLFHGRKQGNLTKKPSKALAFVSIFFLIIGYYLAFDTSKAATVSRFIPIILCIGIGTYFFFTRFIPWSISACKAKLSWYWQKTNFITLSSLAVSWKPYSRIFFIITMIYTVSFCILGTFASSQALNKQFRLDYPLDVGYIANNKEAYQTQNILQIKQELSSRSIHYTTYQTNIKYITVQTKEKKTVVDIPIVSYTDYKNMVLQSGHTTIEPPVKGNKVIGLLTSQLDQLPHQETYKVKDATIILQQEKMSKHVTIPWRLLQNQALIVNDSLFAGLTSSRSATFTGFYSDATLDKTLNLGKTLVHEGRVMPNDHKPYSMIVSGTLYKNQIHLFRILFFIVFLIAMVTFIASGSFLYFQLLSKIKKEVENINILLSIGFSKSEWRKTISIQLAILFFLPITIAAIHSIFALIVLQNFFIAPIACEWLVVIGIFLVGQTLYFLLIRKRYIWKIQKNIYH
jgi:putative ABC transport system permease protein